MARRRRAEKRIVVPDSHFQSTLITKFISKLMKDGKKSVAEKIVYGSLIKGAKDLGVSELELFNSALKNVTPLMEVKSRRVGGSTYQVPIEVKVDRGVALSMRWIIANARNRSGNTMIDRLSREFLDAFNNTGSSVKKKEDTHKMAEANKAFAHFRW